MCVQEKPAVIYLPKPTMILEIELQPEAAARIRAWFAAMYAGAAERADVVAAVTSEITN